MTRPLTAAQWTEVRRQFSPVPVAWCVAIEAVRGKALFLTDHQAALSYAGLTWRPFPMELGELSDSGDGELETSTLTIANIGRLAMPYLEAGQWEDGAVRAILVSASGPDALGPLLTVVYGILGASATREAVSLSLGQPNWYQRPMPAERFTRSRFPGIQRNRN